ncbi:MAG: carboxypeptidase-like regulatory domain-containing protein [Acidobacteria bacterium]|nr:carboxypeptidase-like regulatory domain-containing protein [Acidobacteriota bacterium]
MNGLIILAESADPWSVVSQITNPFSLTAFALAVVLTIAGAVLKSKGRNVPTIVWILIPLLVAMPIGAALYQEIVKSKDLAIYRVRITVYDPQGNPVQDARVTSSFGGEPKKVDAGWEMNIPAATVPKGEKLRITATREIAFLKGQAEITLGDERNPTVDLKLTHDVTATVRGQVMDENQRAIAGARVSVVGYGNEAVVTKEDGNFVLPAHKAFNQQVLLHVEAKGYKAESQWHPAGDYPAVIKLKGLKWRSSTK